MKTPPPTKIDDLLKLAFDQAKLVLIGLGEDLMSSFIIVYPDQIHVLQMPWANDDEKLKAVRYAREEMKKHGGALAYSFLTEAWMTKQPVTWNEETGVLPRDDPNRQEVVCAMATNGFETKHASWAMVRDKRSGRCVDLEPLPMLPGFTVSRFDNLLPGERKH